MLDLSLRHQRIIDLQIKGACVWKGGISVAFKMGDNYKLLPFPNYSIENVNIILRIIHGVYLVHGNIQ